jgi:hypothetical protein
MPSVKKYLANGGKIPMPKLEMPPDNHFINVDISKRLIWAMPIIIAPAIRQVPTQEKKYHFSLKMTVSYRDSFFKIVPDLCYLKGTVIYNIGNPDVAKEDLNFPDTQMNDVIIRKTGKHTGIAFDKYMRQALDNDVMMCFYVLQYTRN